MDLNNYCCAHKVILAIETSRVRDEHLRTAMKIIVQAVENEDDMAKVAKKGPKRTPANTTTERGMVLRACATGVAGLDGMVTSVVLTLVLGRRGEEGWYQRPAQGCSGTRPYGPGEDINFVSERPHSRADALGAGTIWCTCRDYTATLGVLTVHQKWDMQHLMV